MKRVLVFLSCVTCLSVALAQSPPPSGPPDGSGPPPGFPMPKPLPEIPMPRTKSGKPNFDGVWGHNFFFPGDKVFYPLGPMPDVSMMKPWARTEYVRRYRGFKEGNQIPNTSMICLPAGAPSLMMEAHALQIIQSDTEIVFLAETDHQVRVVYFTDKHSPNLLPSWYGDAIAHWEGDTLVIDTVGMNDKTQLDPIGTPHSAALHVVERLTIGKTGEIDNLVTLEDPLALEHPWVYHYHYNHNEQESILENVSEYACAENNKDGYVVPEPQKHSARDL